MFFGEAFSKKFGYNAELIEIIEKINEYQHGNLFRYVKKQADELKSRKIAVLGLAFKPNTPVIEESPAIILIHELLKNDFEIMAYDRYAAENTAAIFRGKILYATTVKDCSAYAPICVLTTMDSDYNAIDDSFIVHNPTVVIDCWRMLDPKKLGSKVRYVAVGRSS